MSTVVHFLIPLKLLMSISIFLSFLGIDDNQEGKVFQDFAGGLSSLCITPLMTQTNSAVGNHCNYQIYHTIVRTYPLLCGIKNPITVTPIDNYCRNCDHIYDIAERIINLFLLFSYYYSSILFILQKVPGVLDVHPHHHLLQVFIYKKGLSTQDINPH